MTKEESERHQEALERIRMDYDYHRVLHEGWLQRLAMTLDLLRAKGVREATIPVLVDHQVGQVSVSFGPPPGVEDGAPAVPPDLGAPKKCPCGHEDEAEHNNNGLCLLGCPVSICHPETVKAESK